MKVLFGKNKTSPLLKTPEKVFQIDGQNLWKVQNSRHSEMEVILGPPSKSQIKVKRECGDEIVFDY